MLSYEHDNNCKGTTRAGGSPTPQIAGRAEPGAQGPSHHPSQGSGGIKDSPAQGAHSLAQQHCGGAGAQQPRLAEIRSVTKGRP